MAPQTETRTPASVRCGIVLAGGQGKRLRKFIRALRGDALPKQYVNFTGRRSMLEETLSRAEKLIPAQHLLTIITRAHLRYPEVRAQLATRPRGTVVVQPANKDTAPGLLLPLVHLARGHSRSTVVVFPSDHDIKNADPFLAHVEQAFRLVEEDPARLVLLGIEPDGPETDYGYIVPGKKAKSPASLEAYEVARFIEKPNMPQASRLIRRGSLWNSFVFVAATQTLLERLKTLAPLLYRSFEAIGKAVATDRYDALVERTYQRTGPVNFSKTFLEALSRVQPASLLVHPATGVCWSDWGSERRILTGLRKAWPSNGSGDAPEVAGHEPARFSRSRATTGTRLRATDAHSQRY